MKRTPLLSIVAAGALTLGGCASSSDAEALRNQVAELQEQVAELRRTAPTKEEVQTSSTRLGEQTSALLKSNATLVTKVDQLEERLASEHGAIEQTNYRLDRLSQQLSQTQSDVEQIRSSMAGGMAPAGTAAAGGTTPVTPMGEVRTTPVPATPGESPTQLYQNSYRDYQQAHYDLAIAGFRDFIQKYPTSDYADNAAYWIGESLYSQKKYRESVAQFDRVVTDYPKSEKVPSALLKKGYAYVSLGNKAQGIVQLQYVVHEHPKSAEAAKAREELKKLGVETR